MKQIKTKYI